MSSVSRRRARRSWPGDMGETSSGHADHGQPGRRGACEHAVPAAVGVRARTAVAGHDGHLVALRVKGLRPAQRHPAGARLQAGDHDGDRPPAHRAPARLSRSPIGAGEPWAIRTSKQGSRSASETAMPMHVRMRGAEARRQREGSGEGPEPPQFTSHVGARHQFAGRLGRRQRAGRRPRSGRPAEHDEPVGLQARHPARQRVFAAAVRRGGPAPAAVHPERLHDAIGMARIARAEVVRGRSLTLLQPGRQHGRLSDPAGAGDHGHAVRRRRSPTRAAAPGRAPTPTTARGNAAGSAPPAA